MLARVIEWNFHHIPMSEGRSGEEFRGIEAAIRSECTATDAADIVTGIVYVTGLTKLDEIHRNDSVLQRPPKTTMQ